MTRRALFAVGLCAALCACEAKPRFNRSFPAAALGADLIVVDMETEVVAVDRKSGERRWSHRRALDEIPERTLAIFPLVCPMVATPGKTVVLAYPDRMEGLDVMGRVLWRRNHTVRARMDCPVLCPDSGVAFFTDGRTQLTKVGRGGEVIFTRYAQFAGIPVEQPQVVQTSGDILIRTERYVASINPNGGFNWRQRLQHLVTPSP